MMSVVRLDDVHRHHEDKVVVADKTVTLGWDGVWYELDLTTEHDAVLWESIRPFIEAGRRVEAKDAAAVKHEDTADIPKRAGVLCYHNVGVSTRRYHERLREYWEGEGRPVQRTVNENGVAWYNYLAEHYKGFEAHLTELDRQRMAG